MKTFLRSRSLLLVSLLGLTAAAALINSASRATQPDTVPPPAIAPSTAVMSSPPAADAQTLVLAGGCFWGMEGVFEHLKGVSDVVTGYAGGSAESARYDAVSVGQTEHAEAIQITYDPAQISYEQLLQVYFSVAHDPTQLNRQGPDYGKQYRSAIFFANADQQQTAQAYINQLNGDRVFSSPIVTQLTPLDRFYPAEAYHQDFVKRNPLHPYVVVHDLPQIARLQQQFPALYQDR